MGTTKSQSLATRHGRGTAGTQLWHGVVCV